MTETIIELKNLSIGYGNKRLSADGAGTETVVFRTGVD